MMQDSTNFVKLGEIRAQDVDIYPDEKTKTYYMVAAGGGGVRAWTSTNLLDWQGSGPFSEPGGHLGRHPHGRHLDGNA